MSEEQGKKTPSKVQKIKQKLTWSRDARIAQELDKVAPKTLHGETPERKKEGQTLIESQILAHHEDIFSQVSASSIESLEEQPPPSRSKLPLQQQNLLDVFPSVKSRDPTYTSAASSRSEPLTVSSQGSIIMDPAEIFKAVESVAPVGHTVRSFPDYDPSEWKTYTEKQPLARLMPHDVSTLDPTARELYVVETLMELNGKPCGFPVLHMLRLRQTILNDAIKYGWYLSRYFYRKFLDSAVEFTQDQKEELQEQYIEHRKRLAPKKTTKAKSTSKKKKKKAGGDDAKMDQ